jgi:hypothetical protein
MKCAVRTSFAIAMLVLGIAGTSQIVSGKPRSIKSEQNMRSIERPNPSWDYDGKRILGHVGHTVILWDAMTGKVLQKLKAHEE